MIAKILAVVERRTRANEGAAPWTTTPLPASTFVRLSGDTDDQEIGAVVWQLTCYNRLGTAEPLRSASTADHFVLPGGLAFEDDAGRLITPGCCAGLETWREWSSVPADGGSPWMGHDPAPWVEEKGEILRVWADGGLSALKPGELHIDFRRDELAFQLRRVEGDLQAFLVRLEAWVNSVDPAVTAAFASRFDQMFQITREGSRPRVA